MKLDNILITIGEFGLYQKYVYALVCFTSLYMGVYAMMSVIFLNTPEHRCKIPDLDNDTYNIQSPYQERLVNNYIPPSDDASHDYDQCHLYSFDYNSVKFDNFSRPINASLVKCNEWIYSDAMFAETYTSKLNIVCDRKHLTSLIKSLFFVGKFVGALVFGNLSDVVGRKITLCISLMMMFGLSFGMTWSSASFVLYAIIMTLIGAATQGIFPVGFVLGVELVGPSKRKYAGTVIEYFFSIGLMILAGVSYLVRHWYYISIICSTPPVLFVLYWWLLPESLRWLISKGKYEEANAILQKAAKVNKVTVEKNLFENEGNVPPEPTGKMWQLFSSRVMLLRTIVILFNWCIVAMIYYGLSLNAGNLGGNFFFNMFLSGLVEIPANTTALLLLDRIGRKKTYFFSLMFGGCACASTILPILYGEKENQIIIVVLAMLGKFGASAAFNTIYFFSTELYPTVVRNAGLGASSCASRFGGIAAPYIADSAALIGGMVGKVFPLGVFGALAILAGLTSLYLPETLNRALPETMEDGKTFGRRNKLKDPRSHALEEWD
ncbi:organic cation transporter protein-like [Ylistrum balloti]|uniref:organic cation transporter protein-like n=1 Tax=Ylistrum balloti TaxID=509963 RepID=UPI002905BE38|nr:organic cation transporter protein-like [Ylistrum balloti]